MREEVLETLLTQVRACRVCEKHLPLGPNPVVVGDAASRILIIGQAPGIKVHRSGVPWNDVSGDTLRLWLDVDRKTFYNPKNFAIVPMGFCYPGKGKSGDLPPRPECAPLWHSKIFSLMPQVELTLVVGSYAMRRYLPESANLPLTQIVQEFDFVREKKLPLVHPSPRNKIWQKRNPWFIESVVPVLQERVRRILNS